MSLFGLGFFCGRSLGSELLSWRNHHYLWFHSLAETLQRIITRVMVASSPYTLSNWDQDRAGILSKYLLTLRLSAPQMHWGPLLLVSLVVSVEELTTSVAISGSQCEQLNQLIGLPKFSLQSSILSIPHAVSSEYTLLSLQPGILHISPSLTPNLPALCQSDQVPCLPQCYHIHQTFEMFSFSGVLI